MCCTIFQNEKVPFQAIKTACSKSGKNVIFAKGLTHGFGPKLAIFPCFFFKAIQARKMCFTIFQNEKTPLQAIKTRSSKSRKIEIFPAGINPWFWSKISHFSIVFFRHYRPGKCVLRYSRTIKTPFQAIKTAGSKSGKNCDFCKTHGFGPKMAISQSFFFGIIEQENVFYDILERKNAFLGYKNSMFKKWKKCDFCKGVNPWFWSKIGHFSMFFF